MTASNLLDGLSDADVRPLQSHGPLGWRDCHID
jgi:hypothetical protein